jgi:hypothetical protein
VQYHPKPKPAVCVPQPAKSCLAVFIGLLDVQELPLYSSVADEIITGGPRIKPPKPNAAV